jgi:hypothetical protein
MSKIENKILELEKTKIKYDKIKTKYKVLCLYIYNCPFCCHEVNFISFFNHTNSKKCKKNTKEYIDHYSLYNYNEKIKQIKNYRKYIIKNSDNIDIIDDYFKDKLID